MMVRPFDKLMVLSEVEAQAHHKWEQKFIKRTPRRGRLPSCLGEKMFYRLNPSDNFSLCGEKGENGAVF